MRARRRDGAPPDERPDRPPPRAPAIRVPTLVLHRSGDRDSSVEEGRYLAARIPGAKFVELPGMDHLPWVGDQDAVLDEVEEFLTGVRQGQIPNRVLATVLFTDIVSSTERGCRTGDHGWRQLLEGYYGIVRHELARFRGREVDTRGDGFLATFDGPARGHLGARCTTRTPCALWASSSATGVHTGEVRHHGEKLVGIAVRILAPARRRGLSWTRCWSPAP